MTGRRHPPRPPKKESSDDVDPQPLVAAATDAIPPVAEAPVTPTIEATAPAANPEGDPALLVPPPRAQIREQARRQKAEARLAARNRRQAGRRGSAGGGLSNVHEAVAAVPPEVVASHITATDHDLSSELREQVVDEPPQAVPAPAGQSEHSLRQAIDNAKREAADEAERARARKAKAAEEATRERMRREERARSKAEARAERRRAAARPEQSDPPAVGLDNEPRRFSGLPLVAAIVGILGLLISVLLATGVLCAAIGLTEANTLFSVLSDVCDFFAGFLRPLFEFAGDGAAKKEMMVAWGFGAVGYLLVGLGAQAVMRGRSAE